MPSIPALVEPAVLRWARVSAGLTEAAAARRVGESADRIVRWESGAARPTVAQLKKVATAYHQPLSVFFLAAPPGTTPGVRDEWSADLRAEYRRAHRQRQHLLDLYELDDEHPPADWRLSGTGEQLAELARETLLRLSPLALTTRSTAYDHLNVWSAGLERAGVLVLATSRGRVRTAETRAFSLHFDVLPVIVVNGADSPRGRLFSLLREYTHLLQHTHGPCDALAADILMPAAAVLRRPEVRVRTGQENAWTYEALRAAAAPFGVSADAFLHRLLSLGCVTPSFHDTRRAGFLAAYEAEKAARTTDGGDWYRNAVRDLGKGYVRQVTDAHRRGVIDTCTAATYLDAKAGQLGKLADVAAVREVLQ